MKSLNIMIKSVSSLCNLRCKYCFYSDVSALREVQCYGIMSEEVEDNVKKCGVEYIQFPPALPRLNQMKNTGMRLLPFYIGLFQLWLDAFKKGNYRSIKFFDDCINLIMYVRPTSSGMNEVCQPQLVVESDGSKRVLQRSQIYDALWCIL